MQPNKIGSLGESVDEFAGMLDSHMYFQTVHVVLMHDVNTHPAGKFTGQGRLTFAVGVEHRSGLGQGYQGHYFGVSGLGSRANGARNVSPGVTPSSVNR